MMTRKDNIGYLLLKFAFMYVCTFGIHTVTTKGPCRVSTFSHRGLKRAYVRPRAEVHDPLSMRSIEGFDVITAQQNVNRRSLIQDARSIQRAWEEYWKKWRVLSAEKSPIERLKFERIVIYHYIPLFKGQNITRELFEIKKSALRSRKLKFLIRLSCTRPCISYDYSEMRDIYLKIVGPKKHQCTLLTFDISSLNQSRISHTIEPRGLTPPHAEHANQHPQGKQ